MKANVQDELFLGHGFSIPEQGKQGNEPAEGGHTHRVWEYGYNEGFG